MAEIELTLDSPITEEQWDMITDVDFDHTNRIWFHTKHGKQVEFVKAKPVKSNSDRIRAMSDEELAEFGASLPCCPPGADLSELCFPNNTCENTDMRRKCWLAWLQSPVDGGDGE